MMEKDRELKLPLFKEDNELPESKPTRFSDMDNCNVKVYNNRKYLVRRKKKID